MTWVALVLIVGLVGGFTLQRIAVRQGRQTSKRIDDFWLIVSIVAGILITVQAVRYPQHRWFYVVSAVIVLGLAVRGISQRMRTRS